ncbi:MAG: hypothetical protein ACTHW2_08705, partial [Tissierella sp.]|uniref:hypothetical protein n=1 Tax=Tissierella sp. TaxID=41274 RepID=UPI003F97EF9D
TNNVEKENSEAKKEEKEEKGIRSNPINVGESVEWEVKFYPDIDDWDALEGLANVTLNKVYEGEEALEMIYFGSDALEDVEEGYIFAVADITVELIEGDEDNPYKTSFEIASVSEDGRKSPFAYTSLAEKYEENEYTDLYPGGRVDIKQAFLVAEGEDFLVEIEENISGSKFFKHK